MHPLERRVEDLFGVPEPALTDQQRALSLAALTGLLRAVEQAVRAGLPHDDDRLHRLSEDGIAEQALRRIETSAIVRDLRLVSALVQRADEHRIAERLRRQSDPAVAAALASAAAAAPEGGYVEAAARGEDAQAARLAVSLLSARTRRQDEQGQPVLLPEDLPQDLGAAVHWWVAAGLLSALRSDSEGNAHLGYLFEQAARAAIAACDPAHSAPHRAVRLAGRLSELGEAGARLLLELMNEGEILLLIAVLAVESRISFGSAWSVMVRAPDDARTALLKGIGLDRNAAALIHTAFVSASSRSPGRFEEALALYDAMPDAAAGALLGYWRIDPALRAAEAALSAS